VCDDVTAYVNQEGQGDGIASFAVRLDIVSGGDLIGYFDIEHAPGSVLEASFLAVSLASFTAASNDAGVQLTWETASVSDIEGFHVLRSLSEDGAYDRLTSALIAASADGSYQFVDATAEEGVTYFYKLEYVDSQGQSTFFGPVTGRHIVFRSFLYLPVLSR
jgi:hypothetical protein